LSFLRSEMVDEKVDVLAMEAVSGLVVERGIVVVVVVVWVWDVVGVEA